MKSKNKFFGAWIILSGFLIACAAVLVLCFLSSARLPDNVGRPLSKQEFNEIKEGNSSLITYAYLSPNASFPREDAIQKLTIHHMAGNLSLEELGQSFSNRDRRASSNYAIDSDGQIALYVEEKNQAWTSSSKENDAQAITIEVANDEIGGDWHVSDAAYASLIALCADICRRNGIAQLVYTGDEKGNLTLHSMFKSETECPGPYLKSRMEEIAILVNNELEEEKP